MILFPAIDLIGGKVVRLERGDRSRCKVYSDDPVAVARSFAEQGASWVHIMVWRIWGRLLSRLLPEIRKSMFV